MVRELTCMKKQNFMKTKMQDIQLTDAPDERFLIHGTSYSSRKAYQLLLHEDIEDDHAALIWRSRAPHKLKIFAWLLSRGRLNTKCNFFHKTIVPDVSCPRCGGPSEDTAHLFLLCSHALRTWERLGLPDDKIPGPMAPPGSW